MTYSDTVKGSQPPSLEADAVTIQIDAGSATDCPLTNRVNASRIDWVAAATISAG